MTASPEVGVVVVGAGVAGLAAALRLQSEVSELLVVDASDRPGGVMRTDHVAGYVVERGPNTALVKAPMLGVLREQGLDEGLLRAEPESRLRCIVREGGLAPAPSSPFSLARSPLLSARAKLRLLAEPFQRRRDASGESVAEFVGRRLGPEVVDALIGPFLTGVYAGDERVLGAEAVFAGLVELERRYGSIALGSLLEIVLARRKRGLRGSHSAPEGLGPFARRLAERLREPPVLGAQVSSLHWDGHAWVVSLATASGASDLRAACVVLAVPAYAAARLLAPVDSEAAALLSSIEYAPIVTLPLGVEVAKLRQPVEGFGFLVPRAAEMGLLGCLFMSRLFPGRAPKGHELLQCMLGGVRWPRAVDEPEDRLLECARNDVDRLLGLGAEPEALGLTRWPSAIPQPGRDHVSVIRRLRERMGGLGGVALAGGYLDGVGVPDAFASGLRAASDLTAS